ncbi:sugar dehydrogenase [Dactylosporangium vinaceum]|uniref:PQQ-dependent sugar dehydrogenase n=1 Tax=Dactylosporangium vinaceum TaxID=53362 RepID=A0ABV5M705_9ACTN|nr:gluconolaconase [Dactylosporangium vinaceum]UAB98034.1 sugar dehydrogenase [Dactylosporangium vinaceum]
MRKLAALLLVATLALTACSDAGQEGAQNAPARPEGSNGAPTASGSTGGLGAPVRVKVEVPSGLAAAPFNQDRYLQLPTGWKAAVYARVDKARFMALTPSGDLLVSQPGAGKVQLVRAGAVSEFAGGLRQPHDMVFAPVGGQMFLFIAESNRVVRYPYSNGDLKAHDGQVVVDGLPDTSTPELRGAYAHVLKNIAVHGETLYVSIASTCNACVEDTVSDPQRAAIYTYAAGGTNASRHLLARGIRNAEGLAFRPGTDELWIVVNNRDNTLVPDDRDVDGDGQSDKGKKMAQFVDDYPPEEFIKVRDGGFYGWPFCNPDPGKGLHDMGLLRDYELNRDGAKADCTKADPIDLGLPAHSAPLGLTFYNGAAIVPLHGSWNRTKPAGYKVLYVPWTANGPSDPVDLATGFVGADGKWWGRPVDAAIDTDGTILISDDAGGTVLRLTPPRAG